MSTPPQSDELSELTAQWDYREPPSGFVDRVARARREAVEVRVPRTRPALAWSGWFAAAALLLAAMALWPSDTEAPDVAMAAPVQGSHRVSKRTSIALGHRGVAVADSGATLRYAIDEQGSASVSQPLGTVFYRVEPGGPFNVTTPHGTVEATGTCFSVRVLRTTTLVELHEGRVALRTAELERLLDASSEARSARLHGGKISVGPRNPDAMSTSLPAESGALRARLREQEQELRKLRADQAGLQAQLDHTPRADTTLACAVAGPDTPPTPACSFPHPEPAVLLEMGRCGVVKTDYPALLVAATAPQVLGSHWDKAGLTTEESTRLLARGLKFRARYLAVLRALFVEAGGTPDVARALSGRPLLLQADQRFEPEELESSRRQLALERAGLVDPLGDDEMALEDRYIRHRLGAGDAFEGVVAEVVGTERARQLRRAHNGWRGESTVFVGECE
ncbi:MAG: FecR domain-containing protein [Nannocystales bacterium]